jgi:integrase
LSGGMYIQEHPKSESSNRRLKLPLFAMDLLTRRRIDAYSELVFPSSTGTPRWPENIRTQWANAVRGTDLEWMTTRSCRKGVAAYLEAAVDIEAAKEQLGHSSSRITAKFYVPAKIDRLDNSGHLDQLAGSAPKT